MMKIQAGRAIAIATLAITVLLVLIDGFFLYYGDPLDGIGLASTYILPPIGAISSFLSYRKAGFNKDLALIIMNVFAFFSIYIYMLLGTIFLGV
ncbi:hypothetical protein [Paenibacillus sp. NPDC093718]|uniref:hypothetical protein n=1 Tax=Paenibacillus sp. NPDC093718 TaxID=3390601 RepID=UPI003D038650